MKISRQFTSRDSVVDLVAQDYNILTLLSRFSIPLGFGNKSIGEVCRDSGIDVGLFLLVINYTLTGEIDTREMMKVSPIGIVNFLHNSHEYFLSYKIPHIRANLLNALDDSHSDINPVIVSFFDQFIAKVAEHFSYEENTVFPYITSLMTGSPLRDYNIDIFRRHHDDVSDSLRELKNLILRYYSTTRPDRMYDVLIDIYNCEDDIDSHSVIENNVLIPLIDSIESRYKSK